MKDLDIAIEELKSKRYTLHECMAAPFRYGRSPDDAEYLEIAKAGAELEKVEYALSVLAELNPNP